MVNHSPNRKLTSRPLSWILIFTSCKSSSIPGGNCKFDFLTGPSAVGLAIPLVTGDLPATGDLPDIFNQVGSKNRSPNLFRSDFFDPRKSEVHKYQIFDPHSHTSKVQKSSRKFHPSAEFRLLLRIQNGRNMTPIFIYDMIRMPNLYPSKCLLEDRKHKESSKNCNATSIPLLADFHPFLRLITVLPATNKRV